MDTQLNRDIDQRDTRLNVRLSSAQMDLIRQAAKSSSQTVTDFVLESTAAAAERVLTDRRWFVLEDQAWSELEAQLARPVVYKPRLAAHLNAGDPFVD